MNDENKEPETTSDEATTPKNDLLVLAKSAAAEILCLGELTGIEFASFAPGLEADLKEESDDAEIISE